MELKHLPKYKHITEHAETYANIDAGSLELFLSLFDISKKMKNRVSFRAVVGQHAGRLKYRLQTAVFSIPFFNLWPADRSVPVMIKQFSDQITVPPDGEIG
ncbi:hypothetical protein M036_03730 [Bacillus subtilis TO-A]|nr:hypothetical protein M036_03730 [Bacillus subtilis TO-A]